MSTGPAGWVEYYFDQDTPWVGDIEKTVGQGYYGYYQPIQGPSAGTDYHYGYGVDFANISFIGRRIEGVAAGVQITEDFNYYTDPDMRGFKLQTAARTDNFLVFAWWKSPGESPLNRLATVSPAIKDVVFHSPTEVDGLFPLNDIAAAGHYLPYVYPDSHPNQAGLIWGIQMNDTGWLREPKDYGGSAGRMQRLLFSELWQPGWGIRIKYIKAAEAT